MDSLNKQPLQALSLTQIVSGQLNDNEKQEAELAGLDSGMTRGQVNNELRRRNTDAVSRALSNPDSALASDTAGKFTAAQEKQNQFEQAQLTYENLLEASNPEISSSEYLLRVNERTAYDILQRETSQEADVNSPFWDAVLDFGAAAIEDMAPANISKDVQNYSGELSRSVAQAKRVLSPKEFKEYLENVVEDVKSRNFIREDNAFILGTLNTALFGEGFNPDAMTEKVFAGLSAVDLITLGGAAGLKALKVGRLAKTTKVPSVVDVGTVERKTATEGLEAAKEVTAEAAEGSRAGDSTIIQSTGPKALDGQPAQPTEVVRTAHTKEWAERGLIKSINKDLQANYVRTFGKENIARVAEEFAKRVPLNQMSVSADSTFSFRGLQPGIDIDLVRADGNPFPARADGSPSARAFDLAAEHGGEIVPVEGGHKVVVRKNMSTADFVSGVDLEDLNRVDNTYALRRMTDGILKPFASANDRALQRNSDTVGMADRLLSRTIASRLDPVAKTVRKLGADQKHVDKYMQEYRDGKYIKDRVYKGEDHFKTWYRAETGSSPSQKVIDGYNAATDLEYMDAYYKATTLMDRYVRNGYEAIKIGGYRGVGTKVVDPIANDNLIYDVAKNTMHRSQDIRPPYEGRLYRLEDGIEFSGQKYKYVMDPKTDEIRMSDVMGYNAGGSRINPDARYFIGSGDGILLSASTESQAKLGQKQLKTLQDAMKNGTLTDELVEANSQWNGHKYTTVKQLEDWIEANGHDFTDLDILTKRRDEAFEGTGSTFVRREVSSGQIAELDWSRKDRLLEHFGGETTRQISPIETLQKTLQQTIQRATFRASVMQQSDDLHKTISEVSPRMIDAAIPAKDTYARISNLSLPNNPTLAERRLKEQADIIQRRMYVKDPVTQAIDRVGNDIAENIVDGPVKFVKNTLGMKPPTRVADVRLQAFTGKVLGASHFLVFAASPVQFIMQASQSIFMASVVSPKVWKDAATASMIMRTLQDPTLEYGERMVGMARYAKVLGISPEKMDELNQIAWEFGVDIIDGELLENGGGNSVRLTDSEFIRNAGASPVLSGGRRLGNAMMSFYNAGERTSQKMSFYSAAFEFMRRNPEASLVDNYAEILRRADNLNFNMRRTSRAAIQQGAAQIPLQFLSHSFRALESVTFGRAFTGAEKARLAGALTLGFGAYGIPFNEDGENLDPEDPFYEFKKYGALDGILNALGLETALAPRLSVVEGFEDLITRAQDETMTEFLLGPSGNILGNTWGALRDMANPNMTWDQKTIGLIRGSTAAGNNIFNGEGIIANGIYTGRSGGETFPGVDFSTTDGMLKAVGFSISKEIDLRKMSEVQWKKENDIRDTIRKLEKKFERAMLLDRTGEEDKAVTELNLLSIEIHGLLGKGYTPSQVHRIRRSVWSANPSEVQRIFDRNIDAQRSNARLNQITGGGAE